MEQVVNFDKTPRLFVKVKYALIIVEVEEKPEIDKEKQLGERWYRQVLQLHPGYDFIFKLKSN